MSQSEEGHELVARRPGRAADDLGLEAEVCSQIFNVSAIMVGTCLTVIGLLRIVVAIRQVNTLADDLLAGTAVMFLMSCLSAYWALRTRGLNRMRRLERFADVVFVIGMVLSVLACIFVTYAFTAWSA